MSSDSSIKANFTDHTERGHVIYSRGKDEAAREAIESGTGKRVVRSKTETATPRFPNRKPSPGPRLLGR